MTESLNHLRDKRKKIRYIGMLPKAGCGFLVTTRMTAEMFRIRCWWGPRWSVAIAGMSLGFSYGHVVIPRSLSNTKLLTPDVWKRKYTEFFQGCLAVSLYGCCFPKIGWIWKPPKWMVVYKGNSLLELDDLGGNTHIFGNTHTYL